MWSQGSWVQISAVTHELCDLRLCQPPRLSFLPWDVGRVRQLEDRANLPGSERLVTAGALPGLLGPVCPGLRWILSILLPVPNCLSLQAQTDTVQEHDV